MPTMWYPKSPGDLARRHAPAQRRRPLWGSLSILASVIGLAIMLGSAHRWVWGLGVTFGVAPSAAVVALWRNEHVGWLALVCILPAVWVALRILLVLSLGGCSG